MKQGLFYNKFLTKNYCKNIFLLIFIFNNIFSQENINFINFLKPDNKKIEEKYINYKKLSKKNSDFKKLVILLGAGASFATVAYVIKKIIDKNKKEPVKLDTNKTSAGDSIRDKFFEKYLQEKYGNKSIVDKCKDGFSNGVSAGFYLSAASLITTPVLFITSGGFNFAKKSFLKRWQNHGAYSFYLLASRLDLIIKQLDLILNNKIYDKLELKEIYEIFVNLIEDLIALIQEQKEYYNLQDNNLINLQDLIFKNSLKFSNSLETGVNNKLEEQEVSKNILNSFDLLADQIFRSLELCKNIFYENN